MANQIEERHHSMLYFDDGDIIISASSKTKSYTEFYRVDKVFLGRHSPIFNDMFLVGGSGSHDELYDGVPRVHLTDNAEDLAGFLGGLYNSATLPLTKDCRDTPRKVEGILRLAFKYETEMIRQVIFKHIESEWPHTYDEWMRRCSERKSVDRSVDIPPAPRPDPALAVRFAMEFNFYKILPAAFYELAIAPDMSSKDISWECLEAADLLRLVAGKKKLSNAWMESIRRFIRFSHINCEDIPSGKSDNDCGYLTSECAQAVANCILDSTMHCSVPTDLLDLMHQMFYAQKKKFIEFCCGDTQYDCYLSSVLDERVNCWDRLPEYFSLWELGFEKATTSYY